VERKYLDFVDANAGEIANIRASIYGGYGGKEEWRKVRADEERRETALVLKLRARLASDVGALIPMLGSLNIKAESDFRSLHWIDSQMRYYGAVGKLLERGLVQEAQSLSARQLFF
jgi:hypothetical protein